MGVSMTSPARNKPLRGTQLLVEHMGVIIRRPSLVLLEIGWRWLFGIPFLWICWRQMQHILTLYPLDASGYNNIDSQNPWVAAVQLSNVCGYYQPHVVAVLRWLLPLGALAWALVSAVGRNLVLKRMHPGLRFRPASLFLLQAAWIALLGLALWGWYRSVEWTAATHISTGGEPDLVGYFVWTIFLSLGFFTTFALVSWTLSVAPLLVLLENRSPLAALVESLRLGKPFTSKLAEINLVMGIVKLALIVLAMVFSAAPLPFADEVGANTLHMAILASSVFYLVANDYFQIVRLQGFIEFWKMLRGPAAA